MHELHSQRAEHHAEQPIRDVRAGDAEHPHERRREPHREQRQRQHRSRRPAAVRRTTAAVPDVAPGRTTAGSWRARPGPQMNGNASGNTEISARRTLSARSLLEVRVPDSRANTISSAMRNSSSPPKMRNASILIPASAQERGAAEREQHQDEAGDQHGLERHLVLIASTGTVGEPAEQRDQRHAVRRRRRTRQKISAADRA